MTPHPGEMARLIKRSAREVEANRVGFCTEYARKWGVVLVLKGAPTVIAQPDGQFWINSHVNSGLATAGSGDVLTGLIAGFLAQKTTPIAAAVSGVYIHSYAGELLRETKGEHGLIAGDIIDAIPEAIVKTLKES
jgi:NAD(P)H-hydrate epimerase